MTRDWWTDILDGSEGGRDTGLLRLGPALESVPVNQAPGGSDPCGVLLIGGTAYQDPFDVIDEGNGRFAVPAFETSFEALDIRRPFLGRFDRNGARLMGQGLAFPAVHGSIGLGVAAAADGAGGYFMVWEDDVPPDYRWGHVVVRRVNADGEALWDAPVRLSLELTFNPQSHALVADGSGGAWIAWDERRDRVTSDPTRTYVQHVTSDGSFTSGEGGVRLRDVPAAHFPAALIAAGSDVIALIGDGGTIRAIRVSPDGSLPWGADGIPVADWTLGWVLDDLRAFDAGDGSFYVFWHEASYSLGIGSRIRVRRMRKDGSFAWPADVAALEYIDGFYEQSAALLPGGELAITARSVGYQTTDGDIYGQAIDRRGRLRTPSTGVPVCKAPTTQRTPKVFAPSRLPGPDLSAPPGSVQALFIWTDPRLLNGDGFFVQVVTFTSRPRLTPPAAAPSMLQGESITLQLEGDDLAPGAAVEIDAGFTVENVTVTPIDPDGPGDRMVVMLRATPGAVGMHGLVVVNPDGSRALLPEAVRVGLDRRRIDLDASGRVDGYDVAVFAAAFGRHRGEPAYSPVADIDGSGVVDGVDLALLAGRFGLGPVV